jgi:hypothetical protein
MLIASMLIALVFGGLRVLRKSPLLQNAALLVKRPMDQGH